MMTVAGVVGAPVAKGVGQGQLGCRARERHITELVPVSALLPLMPNQTGTHCGHMSPCTQPPAPPAQPTCRKGVRGWGPGRFALSARHAHFDSEAAAQGLVTAGGLQGDGLAEW